MVPLYSLNIEIYMILAGVIVWLIINFGYSSRFKKLVEDYKNKKYSNLNSTSYGKSLNPQVFSPIHKAMHDIDEKVDDCKDTLKNCKISLIVAVAVLIADVILNNIPIKYLPNNIDFRSILIFILLVSAVSFMVHAYQIVYNEVTLRKE